MRKKAKLIIIKWTKVFLSVIILVSMFALGVYLIYQALKPSVFKEFSPIPVVTIIFIILAVIYAFSFIWVAIKFLPFTKKLIKLELSEKIKIYTLPELSENNVLSWICVSELLSLTFILTYLFHYEFYWDPFPAYFLFLVVPLMGPIVFVMYLPIFFFLRHIFISIKLKKIHWVNILGLLIFISFGALASTQSKMVSKTPNKIRTLEENQALIEKHYAELKAATNKLSLLQNTEEGKLLASALQNCLTKDEKVLIQLLQEAQKKQEKILLDRLWIFWQKIVKYVIGKHLPI